MPITVPKVSPIDYLVGRKFINKRLAIFLQKNNPTETKRQNKELEVAEQAYREELDKLSEQEIQILYAAEKQKEAGEKAFSAQQYENGLFFNLPHAAADLDFWAKASYWTLDEGIALSLGKDPKQVNWKSIQRYSEPYYESNRPVLRNASPVAVEYAKRRELADRAVQFKQLYNPVTPGFFIAWLKRNEMSYPHILEQLIEKYGGNVMDWKMAYDTAVESHDKYAANIQGQFDELAVLYNKQKELLDAAILREEEVNAEIQRLQAALGAAQANESKPMPQSKRERETLLKMIIGFAVKGYGYDPKKARSSSPKEFASDLADLGIPVSDDTIRSKLIEAAELLPPPDA